MTDAANKLFAAVHEYKMLRSPTGAARERAKLLEAVDTYCVDKRLHELSTTARSVLLLEAKARVCDAYLADPSGAAIRSPGATLFNAQLYAAVIALRELEKTR
jgi:hypothetical protein